MSCLYIFQCPHGKTLNFLHQCELCAKHHLAERAETIRTQQATIERLLAVIAVQRGGLEAIHRQIEHEPKRHNVMLAWNTVNNALAITPDSVELVEVGKVQEVGGSLFASQYSPNHGVKVGEKLYTIKPKG